MMYLMQECHGLQNECLCQLSCVISAICGMLTSTAAGKLQMELDARRQETLHQDEGVNHHSQLACDMKCSPGMLACHPSL